MATPYDLHVAFDDMYDGQAPQKSELGKLLVASKTCRLAPPRMALDILGHAPRNHTFVVKGQECVGASVNPRYPLYSDLRRRYAAGIPAPKLLRVDTFDSYRDFRDERRMPYLVDFDAAYSEAEAAEEFDQPEAELKVIGALEKVDAGGVRIPLSKGLQGRADAWRDGSELLATICVMTPSGVRYMTTGSPVSRHVDELALAADRANVLLDGVVGALPQLASVIGAASLIPQLCAAYPCVVAADRKTPTLGLLSADSDPSLAARMSLLQSAKAGNVSAKAEIALMCREGLAESVRQAEERLVQAQADKARRLP